MTLSYAGVSLCVLTPEANAAIESRISVQDCYPWDTIQGSIGIGGFAHAAQKYREHPPRIGALTWPTGASRWARGFFLATDSQLTLIREALGDGEVYTSGLLVMSSSDDEANTVSVPMFMLPPRPLLGPTGGALWLLVLVDARYFWWGVRSGNFDVSSGTKWTDIYTSLADLLSVEIVPDIIDLAYETAPSTLSNIDAFTPPLLDYVAKCVGQRIVFGYDESVFAFSYASSYAALDSDLLASTVSIAGGQMSMSLGLDTAGFFPATVRVDFPSYCDGKLLNAVTSVPIKYINTGLPLVETSEAVRVLFHPFQAVYDTTGKWLNETVCTALALQYATDFYLHQTASTEVVLPGIWNWIPNGLIDRIEWTYNRDRCTTRILRACQVSDDVPPLTTGTLGGPGPSEGIGDILTVENADASQVTSPCSLLVANNLDDTHKFGRIYTTHTAVGEATLDWQGLRGYHAGDGYHGPEPDIEFKDSAGLTWTISDDTTNQRIVVSAVLTPPAVPPPWIPPPPSPPTPPPSYVVWVAAYNLYNPNNFTYPLQALIGINDQGSSAFGRIYLSSPSSGVAEINWQGLRVYSNSAYYGPEPDIQLEDSSDIVWTVSDDVADKRIVVEASLANHLLVQNVDKTEKVNPCYTLQCNNFDDLAAHKFGRIAATLINASTSQIDWQGVRVYYSPTYYGPEPDLQFIDGYGISIGVADDAAQKTVDTTIAVNLEANSAVLNQDVTLEVGNFVKVLSIGSLSNGSHLVNAQCSAILNATQAGSYVVFAVFVNGNIEGCPAACCFAFCPVSGIYGSCSLHQIFDLTAEPNTIEVHAMIEGVGGDTGRATACGTYSIPGNTLTTVRTN